MLNPKPDTSLRRVAVALSGGVDSAVTAALLKDEGFDVLGVTMDLDGSGKAVTDAERVASHLSIPFHVLDARTPFTKNVIGSFVESYIKGETPVPCVGCNRDLKFGVLADFARGLGAEALATGHYVQHLMVKGFSEMHRGSDPVRDQSYFLFSLTREQLDFARFPLGNMSKAEIRKIAEEKHLPVASKPDSQDICFLPDGDYVNFVCTARPDSVKPGEIIDREGNVLGRHQGISRFTVGQRRGINLHNRKGDENEPLYVIGLDADKNHVIVGPREDLSSKEVHLKEVNWLAEPVPSEGMNVTVKLRSTQPLTPAFLITEEGGKARLSFETPVFGVAPGQAGVIYQETRLLGGGWIEKSFSKT